MARMPNLMIILASTRPGRVGEPVARWFEQRAREHGGFEIQLVDLAELDLPLMNEPNHPRLADYRHDHTRRWSEMVTAADAFVLVTSEYNHSYPAPLKNAIDYLHHEWRDKPVGFVSYGGVAAGTRAQQALEPVVGVLGMHISPIAVNIPFVAQFVGDDKQIHSNEIMDQAAGAMLDELLRLDSALAPLRAEAARA
jgi:NAD(P)H-dependent FMN reductase